MKGVSVIIDMELKINKLCEAKRIAEAIAVNELISFPILNARIIDPRESISIVMSPEANILPIKKNNGVISKGSPAGYWAWGFAPSRVNPFPVARFSPRRAYQKLSCAQRVEKFKKRKSQINENTRRIDKRI